MTYPEIRQKAIDLKRLNLKNIQIDACTFSPCLNQTIDSLIELTDALLDRYKQTKRGRKVAEAYRDNLKKIVEKLCD